VIHFTSNANKSENEDSDNFIDFCQDVRVYYYFTFTVVNWAVQIFSVNLTSTHVRTCLSFVIIMHVLAGRGLSNWALFTELYWLSTTEVSIDSLLAPLFISTARLGS
jgi:hypothetical protein